ncbi:uncharacterized protein LOC112128226 isoform X2 [Cimex lectularius]|uniref:GST N-terminal domain-containing protein n=1 Tax=Cimex lectularius TaxID=79782 RepID=A0A8I6STA7_CIMLE|nr:uncharacterized protein LOC112128226 isoform X2 [Cimex lectularius]
MSTSTNGKYQDSFLEVSQRGEVPAIKANNSAFCDPPAIINYLGENYAMVESCNKQIGLQLITRKSTLGKLSNLFSLHFSKKDRVTFDACALFKVDYPLLHAMLTGSWAYLTILLQMKKS